MPSGPNASDQKNSAQTCTGLTHTLRIVSIDWPTTLPALGEIKTKADEYVAERKPMRDGNKRLTRPYSTLSSLYLSAIRVLLADLVRCLLICII